MTARTWLNASVGAFRNAANWTPTGTPVAGDQLIIEQGEATVSHGALQGMDILVSTPRIFNGGPEPVAPTLALTDCRIAADTIIHTLGEAIQLGGPRAGVLDAIGRVENDGTITAASQTFTEQIAQAQLTLNIADEGHGGRVEAGRFVNHGLLAAGFDSQLLITSTGPGGQGHDGNAVLVNDGTISATAFGFAGIDVNLIGHGTVHVDAAPEFLPSPHTPFIGSVGIGSDVTRVGAGQEFVFGGGHLGISSVQTCFGATLSNFVHATDQVLLGDFHFVHAGFHNNTLSLQDAQGTTERLHFAGMHSLTDFTLQNTATDTLISASHPSDPL